MTKFFRTALGGIWLSFLLISSGCTSNQIASKTCSNLHTEICAGKIVAPQASIENIRSGVRVAIDAIYSLRFEKTLNEFYIKNAKSGPHSAAWVGFDAETVANQLRTSIKNVEIVTYGGLWAFVLRFGPAQNIAYDGDGNGPIRLNEWALPRSIPSLGNTVGHEVAHKVGLTHPSSSINRAVANCEPPYVIGALIEKLAQENTLPDLEITCNSL
ncbi:hypothetical protein F2P45_04865 [Massilia sp. CCM 8733]|uniref:Peptidase M10 metallopeptidase domain-containing protein n=1 Tax=Massilia mucilaginosa TaxID=2609282 RepID=A0ABX0NNI7_9BURK|nr:hypothetical protein [Massilia mucilaginosa]NHZ88360.1 hypothetical protein [Massilia mucilaginosa]